MVTMTAMGRFRSLIIGSRTHVDVRLAWNNVVKRTIGRFVRGNIAAQNLRILLPEEQEKQHEKARDIANKWRNRHKAYIFSVRL